MVVSVVKESPELASKLNWAKRTALHEACEIGAPLFLVQALAHADMASTVHQDQYGYTPLHLSFSSLSTGGGDGDGGEGVVEYLLNICPKAVKITDKQGHLPLHRACQKDIPVSILRKLIAIHPESLLCSSKYGGRPLFASPYATAKQLYDEGNNSIRRMIASPLHWFFQSSSHSQELFRQIQQSYPHAISTTDAWGKMPLHLALSSWSGPMFLEIFHAFPQAAAHADNYGRYPLHNACSQKLLKNAISVSSHCNMINILIEAHSAALWSVDCLGQTPMHKACASHDIPLQSLQILLSKSQPPLSQNSYNGTHAFWIRDLKTKCTPLEIFFQMAHDHVSRAGPDVLLDFQVLFILSKLECLIQFHSTHCHSSMMQQPHRMGHASVSSSPPPKTNPSPCSSSKDHFSLLHECIRVPKCPVSLLWCVLQANPLQIHLMDSDGNTPLHLAAIHGRIPFQPKKSATSQDRNDDDGWLLFVQELTTSLQVRNHQGQYPLSLLIQNHHKQQQQQEQQQPRRCSRECRRRDDIRLALMLYPDPILQMNIPDSGLFSNILELIGRTEQQEHRLSCMFLIMSGSASSLREASGTSMRIVGDMKTVATADESVSWLEN